MQELLFKYRGVKSAKVEKVSATMLHVEQLYPQFQQEIIPLVADYEVGIEVEVEKVDSGRGWRGEYEVWQVKPDNSLRNGGVEYVSLPIKGRRIHFALNYLYSALPRGYHFSPRTSVHVHLNVLDMRPQQIASVLLLGIAFEKLLYRFVGGGRDKNNFAVPINETEFRNFVTLFLDDPWQMPPSMEQHRYTGLNIDSVRKFGTLEFRQLGGTDDKVKICKWLNLIFSLKSFALANSFEVVKARIERLNTDSQYRILLDDVFKGCVGYLDTLNLKGDMEGAVSMVKKLTTPNGFSREIRNSLNAESLWYKRLMTPEKKPSSLEFDQAPARRPRQGPARPNREPRPPEGYNPFRGDVAVRVDNGNVIYREPEVAEELVLDEPAEIPPMPVQDMNAVEDHLRRLEAYQQILMNRRERR